MRPGLRLHAAHLGELLERRDARLVGHVVLAVLHHADAERRPLVGDAALSTSWIVAVFEDLLLVLAPLAPAETASRTPPPDPAPSRRTTTSSPPPRSTASTWLLMWEWLMPMTPNLIARCRLLCAADTRYRNGAGEPRDEFTAIYLVFSHVSPCQTVARLARPCYYGCDNPVNQVGRIA